MYTLTNLFLPTTPLSSSNILHPQGISEYIRKSLDLETLGIYSIEAGDVPGDKKKYDAAAPGSPSYQFFSIVAK